MDILNSFILKLIIPFFSFICSIFRDYKKIIRRAYCSIIRNLLSIGKINNWIKLNKVLVLFYLISSFRLCSIKPNINILKLSAKLYLSSLKIICFSMNLKKIYHFWRSDFKTDSKYLALFISWSGIIFKNIWIIKIMNSKIRNK